MSSLDKYRLKICFITLQVAKLIKFYSNLESQDRSTRNWLKLKFLWAKLIFLNTMFLSIQKPILWIILTLIN